MNVLNYVIGRKVAGTGDIWSSWLLPLPSTFLGLMWMAFEFCLV